MLHKARENLEVAQLLEGWRYLDGAANRAYYAVYHAGWHYLQESGLGVPEVRPGILYWPHEDILDRLEDAGLQPFDDWQVAFDRLHNLRIKADYYGDSVTAAAFKGLTDEAKRMLDWVDSNAGQ